MTLSLRACMHIFAYDSQGAPKTIAEPPKLCGIRVASLSLGAAHAIALSVGTFSSCAIHACTPSVSAIFMNARVNSVLNE